MEEKIYQKIKAGLKNNSVSERSIRNKAVRMSKVYTDETLTDAIVADAVADLEDYAGQLNKEIADAVKMQKEKLEAEFKAKYQPNVPNPPTPPKTEEEHPFGKVKEEWEAKIREIDTLKTLVEQRLQSEKVVRLKEEASKILKERHNTDRDYILNISLSKVKVEDADTPETLAEKTVPIYDTEYKLAYGDGVAPRTGGVSTDTAKADALKTLVSKRLGESKKP